jgi:general secretion pathway protein J
MRGFIHLHFQILACKKKAQLGFTLIEMLVAMALLATLALISWRGLDAMSSARNINQEHQNQVLALTAGLAQWTTDLDAIIQTPFINALEFDGKLLRITRVEGNQNDTNNVMVVAWSKANLEGKEYWIRWQSKPVNTQGELKEQYKLAKIWSDSVSLANLQDATKIIAIDSWSLLYFRGNAWSNALSSSDEEDIDSDLLESIVLPDAIRLQISISPQQALSGTITKDWLKPIAGGTRQ